MAVKPPIERGYLQRKGRRWLSLSLYDLVTLIYNLSAGANEELIGHEDADNTLDAIRRRLNSRVLVDPAIVEALLWSCSMMNEQGKFWDVGGRTFQDFVTRAIGTDMKFDPYFHTLEWKDNK